MARMSTLLVLGSSLTALAVVRAARRKAMRCVMLDSAAGPAAATGMAEFRLARAFDPDALSECTADLAKREDVAVIADSDRWLRFVRQHRGALASHGWRVLHPADAALDVCLDKSAFLAWCAARELPAPRLHAVAGIEQLEPAAYPLMLRPEWTQHSSNTGLPKAIEVREPAQLRYWLQQFAAAGVRPSICESLLREGLRQYSVGAARDSAGAVQTFLAEKVRPHAEQCAGGTFVAPAEQPGIESLAARALQELDFFGVAEVEVLYDPLARRACLIEINARPWLQYGLPLACGQDLLGHVLGDAQPAGSATRSHAWLYFGSDLRICFSPSTGLVTNSKINLATYVRSLLAADVYALWDWRDPNPLLASTVQKFAASLRRFIGK